MPLPAKIETRPGALTIDSNFSVRASAWNDDRLKAAMARLTTRIARETGLPIAPSAEHPTLIVECHEAGPAIPTLSEDETYQLDVTPEQGTLRAQTVTGALRGLATFAQLVTPGREDFEISAVHIEDRPRFPWRGLMLDVSRHWMPLEIVKRNLEGMAAVKLNVFHWHLSDDQGFRVECKRYPRLHELGSDGHFYTQEQVRDVIRFAADRGIRVIPEFDMPGHMTAWFVGYPELAAAKGPYSIERRWGIFEPTIDPTRPETYQFLEGFLAEMAALFPDPFFHIGGDEVKDTQWKQSPSIQAYMRQHGIATSQDLQASFNLKVQKILTEHGKTMIGWDEILHDGLAAGAVIQSWRGPASLADAARKGFRGVLSFGYYLDHLNPASFHYANDPPDSEFTLGGEACMWVEYASPETVDSRIWPRMGAIAERLWSPRDVRDVASMYTRLAKLNRELDWIGLQHRRNRIERLTGNAPAAALDLLASVSEPTGIDVRQEARHYTSAVPLNRFVDSIPPESETVRDLIAKMDLDALRRAFAEWSAATFDATRFPAELSGLSQNLAVTGSIGLETLKYIDSGKRPSPAWIEEQKKTLDRIEQPQAEVVLAAVRPVRLLLTRFVERALVRAAPGLVAARLN